MTEAATATPARAAAPNEAQSSTEQGAGLLNYLMSGQTLSEALGHSPESCESLYHVAYNFYRQAKYEDAMRVFAYLLTLNHLERRYYSGFAACLQMLRRHQDALKYYLIASMLDVTDPRPVMHSAECLLAMGDRAQARTSLDYALTLARAQDAHRGSVERLEAMLSFIDTPPTGESQEK